MSEAVNTPVKKVKSRIILFVVAALALLLLLLVYGAGIIGLPVLLLTNYQSKDCASVLTLDTVYLSLYPRFIEDPTLAAPVQECKAYVTAVSYEEQESWREAYDAYQEYSSAYPNGLFAGEAHQQSAAALLHLAQDQVEEGQYEDALETLHSIIAGYSDTAVINEAWNLFPSVYTPWGAGLREAGEFAGSEGVLNEFKNWSLTNQKSDWTAEAQRELAQTYLAWGLELRSQAQFESAIAKLDLAAAADPESQFDSAVQVKAARTSAYIAWGNALLEDEQFPVAIEKFELALSKTDDRSAADALANGQTQWAKNLSEAEDFKGALEHLASAEEAAGAETMKKATDAALQETYLAFSRSSGSQAREAMKEILRTACKKQDAPDLPIFGLDKDTVRLGISGTEETLPAELAAKTPGEMHYVVCITADNQTVEARLHKNMVFRFGRFAFFEMVEQFRVRVIWNASLVQTDTGESVAREIFKGEMPPPFSETGGNYFYGAAPMEELEDWLKTFLQ